MVSQVVPGVMPRTAAELHTHAADLQQDIVQIVGFRGLAAEYQGGKRQGQNDQVACAGHRFSPEGKVSVAWWYLAWAGMSLFSFPPKSLCHADAVPPAGHEKCEKRESLRKPDVVLRGNSGPERINWLARRAGTD
jgi:hypothetical protein